MKVKTLKKIRGIVGLIIIASFVASLLFGIGHRPVICVYLFLLTVLFLLPWCFLGNRIFDGEHKNTVKKSRRWNN